MTSPIARMEPVLGTLPESTEPLARRPARSATATGLAALVTGGDFVRAHGPKGLTG
jgi:hypothetical protein